MAKEKKEYEVDEILPFVGEFGRFQIIVEALLCIAIIPQTLQVLIMYFAAQPSPWKCVLSTVNSTTACTFPQNQSFSSGDANYTARCKMPRTDWEFVKPKDFSIITQFDLHCDTEIYAYFTTSFFFIGWAIGAVVLGLMADWYGRLKVLFPSLAVLIVVGFISVFSPNFWVFLASRIIVGFFTPGTGVQMFVMASEFVGEKYRPLCGILLWAFFAVALIMLGVKAYLIRQWKTLFIVCTAPYIFTLAFAKFIPESVRWLNLQGRKEEAMKILRRVAKMNKKQIPDDVTLKAPRIDASSEKASPLDLFRPMKMGLRTIIQAYAWMVNGLVYYGVALAADDLGGQIYRDYILTSLVEFPAVILAIVLCNKLGRKYTIIPALAIASISCIIVAFIPTNKGQALVILRIIIGMIGKCGVSVSFDAIYTWSVELYPTIVRAQGIGLLQITSRIGAAGAPWVAKFLKTVHPYAPFLVMGASSLISVFTMFYLPETKGQKTAETLDEAPAKQLSVEYKKDEEAAKANVNLAYDEEMGDLPSRV